MLGKHELALIYARVSSERQKKEGHGLDSQEYRCRDFAKQRGYIVDRVYKDSFTGGGDYHKRPELSRMLEYIDQNPHKEIVVLIDDLSRFARDVSTHFELKNELKKRGVRLECSNFNFEDTPEGELIETMMAAQHQYHRKNNRRQVVQKQKARLELGYWPFYPPPGYLHQKIATHGKLLVPKEPEASIIREAFEGYASGRFENQVDVMRFLEDRKFLKNGTVYLEKVKRMLSRSIYAGYIDYKPWEVSRREGHHEPIVSKDVFHKVERKMSDGIKKWKKTVNNPDFPLRGHIRCPYCNHLMTASYSTSKSGKKVPYYRCNQRNCKLKNKSVNQKYLIDEYLKILSNIEPKEEV